ncbi:DUF2624 family protein [Salibacterium salarium]|uniref:DUF2624 family protein n=1 Tax=Salibacterium salarium TaxID=284579 RepID=A0A3R9QQ54_9BACI|nr:DUF2624 family protein [Salibacterium salarium]RSL30913.1 DUF2624 family protein [Salibacterium salarium]
MNHFKDQWIKYKISELHPLDLVHYGKLYGVTISLEESTKILEIVQHSNWNINDKSSLHALLSKVKPIVSAEAYSVINSLFQDYFN